MSKNSKTYDGMTDDELCELPPAEIREFVEFFANQPRVTEADMSPGERRLWQIVCQTYARWEKQRETLN